MPLRASAGISSAARTTGVWWPLSPRNNALIRPSSAWAEAGAATANTRAAHRTSATDPIQRLIEVNTMELLIFPERECSIDMLPRGGDDVPASARDQGAS